MFKRIINFVAKTDRKLGAFLFSKFSSIYEPKQIWGSSTNLPKEEMLKYFKDLDRQDDETKGHHLSWGEEYLHVYKGSFNIDTITGWCFYNKWLPLKYSFPFAEFPRQSFLEPSAFWYQLKTIRNKKKKIKKAINLIWYGWENYYHFFTDIVPTLMKIKDSEYKDVPILIPSWALDKPYVKEFFVVFEDIIDLNFYEVSDQVNSLNVTHELILVKASRFILNARYLQENLFNLRLNSEPTESNRCIFLTRPKGGLRSVLNQEEVELLLSKYNFLTVETSSMKWIDQVNLFKNVEVCVGIHGAGLTNLIFSNHKYSLLELFPGNSFRPLHYQHQTKILRGNYSYMECKRINEQSFIVDIEILEQKLVEILFNSDIKNS